MFRDVSDTGLNPSLWGTVQQQLAGSRWLVLLACPRSAASRWVTREVDHWSTTKGVETILLVLTDGDLTWDREAGAFAPSTTALAPDVAARFASEPLHLDLRWAREVAPDLGHPRFKSEMARLASPIRGVAPGDLESEDVRLHRTARRLARGAVAALVVLAVTASLAAALAVRNAREAERRAREATARQVGLAALDLDASELDEALLLSLAASRLGPDDGPDRFLAARTLLGRHSRLVSLLHTPAELREPSLQEVAISPSGAIVTASAQTAEGDSFALSWDVGARTDPAVAPLSDPSGIHLAVRDDGATVALPGSTTVAVDPDATRAVVVDAGRARLVDPGSGSTIAEWPDGGTRAAIVGDRAAIASGAVLHLVDTRSGSTLASVDLDDEPVGVAVRDDTVLTVSASNVVSWWTPVDGRLIPLAEPVVVDAVGAIDQLVLADDERRALIVGARGSAIVDGPQGAVRAVAPAHGAVAVDPTGRFAAIGGARLVVWDLATGELEIATADQVHAMAWSGCRGAPCRLVTVGVALDVWEPATGRRTRLADQTNAQSVAIADDGGTVVSAGWGSNVAVWTIDVPIDDTGRTELAVAGAATALDPRSGAIARTDGDGVVVTRDGTSRRVETGPVDRLHLVADATRLLAVADHDISLFDVERGVAIAIAPSCAGDLWAVSPGGTRLVVHRHRDGRTVVCDTADGSVVAGGVMIGTDADATAVAVDDDGSVVIARAGEVAYHAVADGGFARGEAVAVALPGEEVAIGSLALRDGRLAAAVDPTGDGSARVLVWDAASRGTAVQFESDHHVLVAVTLLGEGGELVAVAGRSSNGTVIQVWEAVSRRRLGLGLGGLDGTVVSLAGDTTAVVGVDATGRAYQWALDRDPRREVCEIVGRDLTRDEWPHLVDGALARYDYTPVCAD